MEEAAAKATLEELQRKKTQSDLQDRYRLDLEKEKMVKSFSDTDSFIVFLQVLLNKKCAPL